MEVIEADNLSKLIKALITERSDGICNIEAFISQFHGINVIRTKEDTTYFIAKADKKKALGLLKKYGENNQRLFVKLSPIHSRGDPGFAYERFLYRLSEHILQTHITPNIVREVMSFRCEKFDSFSHADSPIKKALNQLFGNVKNGPAGLGVLITEAVDGKSLRSTVAILDAEQLSMVLFQIYYTLQEFHYLGIRHNDLHDENIILEPYLDTKQMIYVVSENEYYAFVPKYIVKILDFDLSTLTDEYAPFTNELSLGKHFCQGAEHRHIVNAGHGEQGAPAIVFPELQKCFIHHKQAADCAYFFCDCQQLLSFQQFPGRVVRITEKHQLRASLSDVGAKAAVLQAKSALCRQPVKNNPAANRHCRPLIKRKSRRREQHPAWSQRPQQ